MTIFFRVSFGLILVGIGIFMVLRTRIILDFFGTVDWAELKLGGGGSNLFYKLIGVVFILIGFVIATNLWNALLGATLGSVISR